MYSCFSASGLVSSNRSMHSPPTFSAKPKSTNMACAHPQALYPLNGFNQYVCQPALQIKHLLLQTTKVLSQKHDRALISCLMRGLSSALESLPWHGQYVDTRWVLAGIS